MILFQTLDTKVNTNVIQIVNTATQELNLLSGKLQVSKKPFLFPLFHTKTIFSFKSLDTKVNTNVIFAVEKFLDKSKFPMKFKNTIINLGNSMDAKSGTFTCKVPGYYEFSFHGRMYPDGAGDILVRLDKSTPNGVVTKFYAWDDRNKNREWGIGSSSWIVKLDRSDTITMNAHWGTPPSGEDALFSGHLIWSTES